MMKKTKISHLASLFVAAFLLTAANIIIVPDAAFAAPKSDLCKGKKAVRPAECDGGSGDDGDDTTACKIDFDAVFRDEIDSMDRVMSDGGSYHDGMERMMIRTGSGPGFRFDTNGGSQKLEGAGGFRQLKLTVPYIENKYPGNGPIYSGVDLRFDLSAGGLDLCALKMVGDVGHVGLNILFEDNVVGMKWIVKYDAGCTDGYGTSSSPVDVERTGEDTWTIKGVTACLFEYDGPMVDGPQTMPFLMTITAQ